MDSPVTLEKGNEILTTINKPAQFGQSVVTGVINTGISLGEDALFLEFPWLAVPGLKQLTQMLINWLAGYVIKGLSQVVVFSIIEAQASSEKNAYEKALTALRAAQASGDPTAITKALHDFQDAAIALTHLSASPHL